MQTKILGTTMPVLEVELEPNESVFSESGELSWMTANIQMTTHTQMGGGGGLFGVIKRVAGGGSLFMTEYRANQAPGSVSFAAKVPGHIVPVQLGQGPEYMVHRHGFLCATPQRIGGQGTAWLELSGELIQKNLGPGETLLVHPGHVGAFQASMGFQITMVPGIKNMIFGGDGIFLAVLQGPGAVWLQTLPISRLAHQIYEYLPHNEGQNPRSAVGGALLGGIVGSILGGDK
jgi:uncharacterized protein (AIM24 family)